EAEAVHLKVRREQDADEIEQQRVDDEREQAKRENQQRQREEHQNRPDERVEDAEQQGGNEQIAPALVGDVAVQQCHRHQHREGVDEPALQKVQESSGSRLHGRVTKISVSHNASHLMEKQETF